MDNTKLLESLIDVYIENNVTPTFAFYSDMLIENGAFYSNGESWAPYALQDGNLITGQNPASSQLVAEKLLESLK